MAPLYGLIVAFVFTSVAHITKGDGCTSQQTYNNLLHDLNNKPCMTDVEVWNQLHHINYASCRRRIAQHMYEIRNTDGTSECKCNGTIHHLSIPQAQHGPCDSHYKALEHYYANTPHCRTHHFLWNDYHLMISGNHQYSSYCSFELTTRIFTALNARGANDCRCWKDTSHVNTGAIETCTNPQTDCHYEHCTGGYVPACVNDRCTCHAPSSELVAVTCNEVKTITDIALNLSPGSHRGCDDGVHSHSWTIIPSLCNMTIPKYAVLTPGEKVKTSCSSIPPYTAVARFDGDLIDSQKRYTTGILIGCETDHFKIVTEDCHSSLHVEHILLTSAASEEYFVVKQPKA